ncbi:MAG: hypothetical protein A3J74_10480 [Elusimicrobia bacterium RIFCSPHIGHO2_02_FULL_57_9]|nr:MAG: hypothetical protein A3J74_10480 [Elusimicrobia bacterium RIFCSPHIGHO2_02_FULL_57_9]
MNSIGLPFLSSFLAVALPAASAWAAPTLTVGIASGQAATTVSVPISFDPVTDSVAGIQFNLTLPASLSTGAVTAGAVLNAAGKSVSANKSGNTWTFIIFGLNQNAITAGTLLTAQLIIAPGTAAGTLSLPVSGVIYSDPSGSPIAAGASTGGTVTVTAPADTTPPAVSMTAPASAAIVSGSAVAVSATASDNMGVAGVQFRLNGANLGAEDTAAPFSISWNSTLTPDGSHTLTAVARDAAGNSATSAARTVTVSNIPAPPPLSTGPVVLAWDAVTTNADGTPITDLAGYRIFQSLQSLLAQTTAQAMANASIVKIVVPSTQTSYSIPNLAGPNTYYFRLTAFDTSGNQSGFNVDAGGLDVQVSTFIPVGSGGDITPPAVAVTSPVSGAVISSQSVTVVSASASDNIGVAGVQFKVDGQNLGTEDTAAPYTVAWNTALAANGIHTLTAVARDAAANSATSAAVTVTVNNSAVNNPPVVSPIGANIADVDAGAPGIQFYEGTTVIYSGQASDADNDPLTWTWFYARNGAARVSFLSGSGTVSQASFNYPLGSAGTNYQWILSVSDGKATSESTLNVSIIAAPTGAPTLTVASASGPAGTTINLPVSFSPGAASVASLQFSLTLPASLSTGAVTAGAILNTAGKSVSTSRTGNNWNFIVFGLNQNTIAAGALLTAQLTIAAGTPAGALNLPISGIIYSDPSGTAIAGATSTGGTVTVTASGADTTAPTVSITSPLNNSSTLRNVTVQISGSDNVGATKVELWADGRLEQSQAFSPASPTFSATFSWKAPKAGFHTLQAKAYDAAGNAGQSALVTIRVHPPGSTTVRYSGGFMIVGDLTLNGVECSVPIGVVSSSADFAINPESTGNSLLESLKRADENGRRIKRVGAAVEIEAADLNTLDFITQFSQPILLTAKYDPVRVTDPRLVGIFYWDEARSRWQNMPAASLNTANNTVSVLTDHLTTFAVYEAEPAGTAAGSLEFGEVFSFPSPAKGGKVTIHVELPPVDSVEARIYDLNGRLMHRMDLNGPSLGINGKQAYEGAWDISGMASGSYMYAVSAVRGSQAGRILKKLAIIK